MTRIECPYQALGANSTDVSQTAPCHADRTHPSLPLSAFLNIEFFITLPYADHCSILYLSSRISSSFCVSPFPALFLAPNVWALYNVVDKALAKTASVLAQTVSAGRLPPFLSSTVLLFFPSAPPSATLPSMTGGLVHNIQHAFLPSVQPMHTILLTLLCTLPALWKLWRRPHPLLFPPVLVYATLTFFMCGWHVHEKAILVVLLPLALLALDNLHTARTYLFMSLLAHFSLFPLFFEPREAPIKLLLTLAYTIVCVLALGHYTQHLQHLKQTNRGPGAKEASSRYLGVLTLWEALYLSLTIPIQVFTR